MRVPVKAAFVAAACLVLGAPAHANETCAPFDRIVLERLSTQWTELEGEDASRVWSQWAERPTNGPGRAGQQPWFRISATGLALAEDLSGYEVEGLREPAGWRLRSRTSDRVTWSLWTEVETSRDIGDALDDLFADGCLWDAPKYLPPSLPLQTGGYAVFFDGYSTMFDVQADGRHWGGWHMWALGAPGDLRRIALDAAFPDRNLTPVFTLDDNVSEEPSP